MPNPARYDNSLEAAIRAHFALTQDELARYLGVTERHIGHLEAGRRQPTPALSQRLHWLADLLPPPEGQGPAAPDFSTPPPPATPAGLLGPLPTAGPLPAAPLRKRQQQAAAKAAALRRALHEAGKRAARQARRAWALAVLQAAAPPVPADAAGTARQTHWLTTLAADVQAAAPTPVTAVARVLALLRLRALEAEAEALGQLLG